jgi:hypothetical protein
MQQGASLRGHVHAHFPKRRLHPELYSERVAAHAPKRCLAESTGVGLSDYNCTTPLFFLGFVHVGLVRPFVWTLNQALPFQLIFSHDFVLTGNLFPEFINYFRK